MIVLESCDGAGKSTVARLLSDKTGYQVVKGSSFELSECTKDDLFNNFFNMIINYPQAIFDRFHISNYVYASLFEGYPRIDKGEKRFLESMMEVNDTKLVYLHADVEILQERLRNRGDKDIKPEDLNKIVEKYEEVFEETNYPHIKIDTGIYNPEQVTKLILDYTD